MKRYWQKILNEWQHPEEREFVFPTILGLMVLIWILAPAIRARFLTGGLFPEDPMGLPSFPVQAAEAGMNLILMFILMASIWAYSPRKRLTKISFVLFLAAVGAMLLNLFFMEGHGRAELAYMPMIPLLFIACYRLLKYLIQAKKVGVGTLSGAVLCYLLLPMSFTQFYVVAWLADPAPFNGLDTWSPASGMSIWDYAVHHEVLNTLQYFSMTTFTTLGYGDITPKSPVVRSLATGEAALGQIYVGIIIAKLVSLYMAGSSSSTTDREE